MRQKSRPVREPAEQAVREIHRIKFGALMRPPTNTMPRIACLLRSRLEPVIEVECRSMFGKGGARFSDEHILKTRKAVMKSDSFASDFVLDS
jgi:hypothetical protein